MMDVKGLHDVYQMRTAPGVNRPARRPVEELMSGAGQSDGAGVDMIKISPEASFRNKLDAQIKSYAQQAEHETAQLRVEKLRDAYGGDRCPVSAAETVQAMFNRLSTQTVHPAYPQSRVSGEE